MRFPTTVLALYLLSATNSHGDVVKTDLRSAPLAAEQFVFFCAEGPTSLGAVGFVHGDQGSGFQTDDWMVGGQNSAISARQNGSNKVAVEACSKNALSNRAIMFVAELDSKVYSSAKDALAQFRTKGKVEITDLIVGLGQVIGVRLPTVLSKPFEYIRSLATLNPGRSVSAGEWLWQPPTIRMSTPPTPADAAPSSSPDKTSAVSPSSLELLPTGMADIKFVNRSALEHLFQALADAEDNSNVSYDIELHISDNIVHDTFVHPVQMRSDVTLEHGDSACVFANLDVAVPNLIELLNKVLVLPSTNAAALTRTFGFAGHSPLLGTSSDWQAAVTMPAGCYLTAVNAPTEVALLPVTAGMKYVSTLVRGFPRFPADSPSFNEKAPLSLNNPTPTADATEAEAAWNRYRLYVNQTKTAAKIRSETFAQLSTAEIAKRRSYVKQTNQEDAAFMDVRKYFRLREIGWHEFQANKYKGLLDDLSTRYTQGEAALYTVAIKNLAMLKSTDIGPSLVAQLKQYQAFMNESVLAKQIVAERYDSTMTPWGRVCDAVPAQCASVSSDVGAKDELRSVMWSLGDKKQDQFQNILQIGTFSSASTVTLDAAFGSEPPNSNCMTFAPPPSPMQSGPTIFNVNVSNTAKLSRELTLVYAGSFVRAYWSGQADSAVASFQAGETKQIEIEFNPAAGYEDLNAIYLLESGRLQSELILDYSIVSDPLIHTIEIDSGGVESGNAKDWGTYDISVSKPPLFHSVRKECVWTTGDRTQCVQNNYATCKLNPTSEDQASATFALQGHSESPGARNLSVGHLRVAYQLTGPPVALK